MAISTALRSRSLVISVIRPPLSRRTRMRRSGIDSREIAFAGEHDLGIVDDPEAVADDLADVAAFGHAKTRVVFRARDEESIGIIDLFPPAKVIVTLVEDVGGAGLDLHLAADLDIVDGRRCDLHAAWTIGTRVVDDVHLHAADAAIPFGPAANFTQRDRARVNQPHHLG